MSVKVAKEENVSTFKRSFHHQLDVIINGVKLAGRSDPLAIHISTHQTTSIVANNNTVWVQHRHNFEYKLISQHLSVIFVAYQEINHATHQVRGVRLAWVHAGS